MFVVIMAIAVFLCLLLIPMLFRKITWNKLNQEILKDDYTTFYRTLDSFICKMGMSAFERENMRLSGLIAQNRKDDVEEQFNMMMNMRLKDNQKLAVRERGFYYYLQQGRAKKAKDMLDAVRSLHADRAKDLEIQYSILIKKESKYIKEVQEKIDHLWDGKSALDEDKMMVVGTFEYLLGLQYSYLNDIENMKKVFTSALKHCAGTPYEDSIKQIMEQKA
ncbi:hypothetical protein [Faecalicoccus pleomorphus]|uniref:Uncharacterized protein n=1 Tax=Faecalicoccus pleomorphus TaxID=1323 RepID=A0A380LJ53_9FIRM|nr:hypothetical protein [Faecalicoccus pleomorphus]SUO03267.1 Uncharacterised protein [Faecalicoccus pleomorphus]